MPKSPNPTLAELFTAAVAKHKTQAAVAKRCGMSQGIISMLCNGKVRSVKPKNVMKTARCLGVKPEVILLACAVPPKMRPLRRRFVLSDQTELTKPGGRSPSPRRGKGVR